MNHHQGAEQQSQLTKRERHSSKNRNLSNAKQQQQQQQPQEPQQTGTKLCTKYPNAQVKIIEQPASKAIRFRYECEQRSAAAIVGVNSTAVLKTYPTIEVVGYKGPGVVVVSCVTKDAPYRTHPHSLIGKEGCRKGVCTVEINSDMRYVFRNLGIQCVRKKDIEEALKLREEIRVDPFKKGFAHRTRVASIDLNVVRLCFQVFIEDDNGRFTIPVAPVVSEPILNRNSGAELTITEMCSTGTVLGNTQIMLLCEKVSKDDIVVRFYEEKDGRCTWEAVGRFRPPDVHKQTSIRLRTPRYHNIYITKEVKVHVQLKRPSDGEVSDPWQFTYKPLDTNLGLLKRKYTPGKGAGAATQQQQAEKQTPTSNPDISELMSDIEEVLPVNNLDVFPTSGQMTPSPQPTSPPVFDNQDMKSLYNKLINNNTPPKSPQAEIGLANVEYVGPAAHQNLPTTSKAIENLNEYSLYNAYNGGQQQQQDNTHSAYPTQITNPYHQPAQATQQQNFGGNLYYNASSWDEGYANILRDVNNGNLAAFTATAINNFYSQSNNHFNMQQNALGFTLTPSPQHLAQPSQWNFPANNNMQSSQWQQWAPNDARQQKQQHIKAQHQAHEVHQHATPKIVGEPKGFDKFKVNNLNATAGNTQHTSSIGNLLNLGSDELRKITCEDQDMLALTNDELQLSNLYIST